MEEAFHVATSPHDFKLMVAAAGKPKGEGQSMGPGHPTSQNEPQPTAEQPAAEPPGVATVADNAPPPPLPSLPEAAPAASPQQSAPPPGF
jgi:hypothetical protein